MVDFAEIDALKKEFVQLQPFPPELAEKVDRKFLIEWTYHSCAIEGNSLNLQETALFLEYGLTSGGKTLKDFFEIQNHALAIEWLREIIAQNKPISESIIKELHALLFKGVNHVAILPMSDKNGQPEVVGGRYKTQPNYVITADGELHYYCDPIRVPEDMEKLIQLTNDTSYHPVELAARVHHQFVSIHPFDDGNGRVARMLMNLVLMKQGYPPAIIKNDYKEDYYRALMKANKGKLTDFINLVAREVKSSLLIMISFGRVNSSNKAGE